MPRPTTKTTLLEAAHSNFEKLWQFMDSMSDEELNTPFDFSNETNKKEAHWARDKNLRDVLIHLYEWHQLLLKWIKANTEGRKSPFLPEPYTWKTYGEMNVEFWKQHQSTALEASQKMVRKSHESVLSVVSSFSDQELFTKKHFDWTGTTTLGSYCVSALSSHYDWAIKKLRAHRKLLSTQ